jgi:hypothetical protein
LATERQGTVFTAVRRNGQGGRRFARHYSRKDAKIAKLKDEYGTNYFPQLRALASWREVNPNPEENILQQRRHVIRSTRIEEPWAQDYAWSHMTEVDVHDAKRQLSRIIEMLANGEEIIITKSESLSRG